MARESDDSFSGREVMAGTQDGQPGAAHGNLSLEVLKALGDDRRHAIYTKVLEADHPMTTVEIADAIGLHPNTVRPHLERLRDAGLIQVESANSGTPGRPKHLYCKAVEAPELRQAKAALPALAEMLLEVASASVGDSAPQAMVEFGRRQGASEAALIAGGSGCPESVIVGMSEHGFRSRLDGGVAGAKDAVVEFTYCPFRDMDISHPDLVCSLHRGLVEGMVEARGGSVVEFRGSYREPETCRVGVAS